MWVFLFGIRNQVFIKESMQADSLLININSHICTWEETFTSKYIL